MRTIERNPGQGPQAWRWRRAEGLDGTTLARFGGGEVDMTFVERRAHGVLRNARDPVCGTDVSVVHPNAQTEWRGVLYRFCSEECQRRFERDADGYVAG